MLLLLLASFGCAPVKDFQPVISSETSVTVDRRIELMGVIQLLSGYFLVSSLDSEYKRDASRSFEACSDHAAVAKFSALSANGFAFNSVPEAFIALSQPPDLEPRFPFGKGVIESAGGEASLKELLVLTREFARDCRFDDFYASHLPEYQRMIDQSRPAVRAATQSLAAYLGTELGSTEVVLGPLLHDGGFATRFDHEAGQAVAYAFIGPESISGGAADFGDAARLQPLVAHEFAHTVINPLTARHASEVARTSENFEPLRDAMRREGYAQWDHVINESIIRALTARLTAADRGEDAAKAQVAEDVKRGFVYLPALVDELREYEASRPTFPRIADFYPDLLRIFRQSPKALPASRNDIGG